MLVALMGGLLDVGAAARAESIDAWMARSTTLFPLDVPMRDGLAIAADSAAREVIARDWHQGAPCSSDLYVDTRTDPKAGWAAYAVLGGCGVWLNPSALEDVRWELAHSSGFEKAAAAAALCRLYVHEREHNLGVDDNAPGSDVMRQGHMYDWATTPGRCQSFGWLVYRAMYPTTRAWRLAHSDARFETVTATQRPAAVAR